MGAGTWESDSCGYIKEEHSGERRISANTERWADRDVPEIAKKANVAGAK